jgi:hypothetical protein
MREPFGEEDVGRWFMPRLLMNQSSGDLYPDMGDPCVTVTYLK